MRCLKWNIRLGGAVWRGLPLMKFSLLLCTFLAKREVQKGNRTPHFTSPIMSSVLFPLLPSCPPSLRSFCCLFFNFSCPQSSAPWKWGVGTISVENLSTKTDIYIYSASHLTYLFGFLQTQSHFLYDRSGKRCVASADQANSWGVQFMQFQSAWEI